MLQEVKEAIQVDPVKAVDTKPIEDTKDLPVPAVTEEEKPTIEEAPCVTEEKTEETKTEPITVEEVKKTEEEEKPSEVTVADKEVVLPPVEVEEKKPEPVKVIEEETPKTEEMAEDKKNEPISTEAPVVEVEKIKVKE